MYVVDDFDDPVIMDIADGGVSVTRDFVVQLGHRSRDVVRVQIAGGRRVLKSNDIAVLDVLDGRVRIVRRLTPSGKDVPVVVVILVVIASSLLLSRAYRVHLYMRMEQSATETHILQCELRPIRDLCSATSVSQSSSNDQENEHTERIEMETIANQIGLEQGGHLCVPRARVMEYHEVDLEGRHVHEERQDDETRNSCDPMPCLVALHQANQRLCRDWVKIE